MHNGRKRQNNVEKKLDHVELLKTTLDHQEVKQHLNRIDSG
jgi:hypothetical protein